MLEIYAGSHLILSFGFTGRSRRKVTITDRDFESPFTGTTHLAIWSPMLMQHFRNGEAILLSWDRGDLTRILPLNSQNNCNAWN